MHIVIRDAVRLTLLLLGGLTLVALADGHLALFGLPPAAGAPIEFAGCALFATAMAHLIRRLLFHRLDLQHFALRAFEHPVGAGLVVLGLCMVIQALMPILTVMLTKG
ncbi:hypothetical protein [Paludibacterium paludis]|uniref:Uncharacterized protein n=1 Tax=Paludibacterium paludis TaxID=1225769 RepID=A0A918NYS1_9NEIS|nr:hypothetical protein [Paludibacterium paludis]GGY07014.1 hypothetical protein GCM10011289_07010 [Paludibacterium paludis]